jgi:hypothetical protein
MYDGSSLHFKLILRFDKVKNCIFKSTIDLGSSISFDEEELNIIHNLLLTLESVKFAVEARCLRDATLFSVDTMILLCDKKFEHQRFSLLVEGIAFMSNKSTKAGNTCTVMQPK